MLNTKTRLFCFLKKVVGASLKSQLWLLAPANQKISSRTASGAALKTAAPAPQHWLQYSTGTVLRGKIRRELEPK